MPLREEQIGEQVFELGDEESVDIRLHDKVPEGGYGVEELEHAVEVASAAHIAQSHLHRLGFELLFLFGQVVENRQNVLVHECRVLFS